MTIRRFAEVGAVAAAFYVLTASPAAAACCDHAKKDCCSTATMTCCETTNDPVAEAVLVPQIPEPRPVRQSMVVWFKQPVKIGDRLLYGQYVIEHDNDRMARGEPCTHIYAAADRRLPVVAFHCEHLDRPRSERASVTVRRLGEPNGMSEFRDFQFAGELGAHGFPASR
jgi:hypothetical protein